MKSIAVLLILFLGTAPAWGAIYRWTDAQGNIHFSDKPHPGARRVHRLPQLNSYSAPAPPPTSGATGGSAARRATHRGPGDRYQRLRVVSPKPNQTFRSAARKVSVSVSISPALASGDRVVYYLDGNEVAGPTSSTSVVLKGIDRGTHNVGAAVVGPKGRELIRAVPVTIFMKPPIIKRNNPAFQH